VGKGGRDSKSRGLPACPYAAEILRLLRPEVIVMEERRGWRPAGKGWGTWIHHAEISAKLGKRHQSAAVMTTDLDGSKVALVLANHPSRSGRNYRETILLPAIEEAICLVAGREC